jgi:hypothetical protein
MLSPSQTVMNLKEKKEMDDLFKKAQKPWAKYLTKVNKAKADYHAACKNEKSALNQERNAESDSSLSADQVTGIVPDTCALYLILPYAVTCRTCLCLSTQRIHYFHYPIKTESEITMCETCLWT